MSDGTNRSTPIVSVIIPAYNCSLFLPSALESVFAQTFTDFEIIVVDDGSTDNIASALAPYIDRITLIRQRNQGVSAARNAGLKAAHGEFLAWLDADDVWLKNKLELQLPLFADPAVGLVYADFETRYDNGTRRLSFLTNHAFAATGNVFERYAQSRFFLPSTVMMRRACVDQEGVFDEELSISEDVELFARICLSWQVASIVEVLTIRNEATHNLTANKRQTAVETISALKKILARKPLMPSSARHAVKSEIGRQYWWIGYEQFQQHNMSEARHNLLSAVQYDWHHLRKAGPLLVASILPSSVIATLRRIGSRTK